MKMLRKLALSTFVLLLTISFSGLNGVAAPKAAPKKVVQKTNTKSKIINDKYKGRQIQIYLPVGYDNSKEKFPVVYMQDGENLFASGDGKWGMTKTLDKLIQEKKMKKVIVVGIFSSDSRADEYSPYKDDRSDGKGAVYAEYLVKKIIPYIDGKYRTIANRENRAIMGSSLGGELSFWVGMKYANVFSMIGALSPYLWAGNGQFLKDLDKMAKPNMKVWIDMGAKEFDAGLARLSVDTLMKKGYKYGKDVAYYEDKDGEGNEKSWASRVAYPLIMFKGIKQNSKFIDYKLQVENGEFSYFGSIQKYTIVNPLGEFDNGLKYTLLKDVKFVTTGRSTIVENENVVDNGTTMFKTHITGNLKMNGESKTEVSATYNGITKKIVVEDKQAASAVSTLRIEFINAPVEVRGKTAYWNGEVGDADQPVTFDSMGRGALILMSSDIEIAIKSGKIKAWGDENALNGKLLKTPGDWQTAINTSAMGNNKIDISDTYAGSAVVDLGTTNSETIAGTVALEFINAPVDVRGKTAYWNGEVGVANQPVVFDGAGRGTLILKKADIEKADLKAWGDPEAINGKLLKVSGNYDTPISNDSMSNNKIDISDSKCGTAVVDLSVNKSSSIVGILAVEFLNAPEDVNGKIAYWNGEAGIANQPVVFDSAGRGILLLKKVDLEKADLKAWGDPEAVNGKLLKASGDWKTVFGNSDMSNNKISLFSGNAIIDLSIPAASFPPEKKQVIVPEPIKEVVEVAPSKDAELGTLRVIFVNAPEEVKGKVAFWNGEAGIANQPVVFDSAGRGTLVLLKSDIDKADLKAWGDPDALNGKLLKVSGDWKTPISSNDMGNYKIDLSDTKYGTAVVDLAIINNTTTAGAIAVEFVNAPVDVTGKTAYWNGEAGIANQPVIFDNAGRGTMVLLKADIDKADLKAWGDPDALNGKLLKVSGDWKTPISSNDMGNYKIDLSDTKYGTAIVDLAIINNTTTVGAITVEFINAPVDVIGKTAYWNGEAGIANQPIAFDLTGRGILVLRKADIDKADLKAWGDPEALNGKLLKVSGDWKTLIGCDDMGNNKIGILNGNALIDLSITNNAFPSTNK